MTILFVAFFLAVFALVVQGTMDERKLFVLWAIFGLAIHAVLAARRKRSMKRDSG
ncbi:hypothetical protein [Pedococcus sp.]|uniref:hypothetical protein n=1 Tax=Pedococcus sp. TaxID=2860345 RepID=UPI002E0DCBF9|nr:hypothetical protein [Pedococcus sp.]